MVTLRPVYKRIRMEKLLHACSRSREIKSQSKAIILKGDCEARHTNQCPASEGSPSNLSPMACHWCSGCVVACRDEPSGCTVDRPTVDRGAHPAPAAGLA